jgi:hypothetical protein
VASVEVGKIVWPTVVAETVSGGTAPLAPVVFNIPSVVAIVVPTELELCIVILKKQTKKQKKKKHQ